MPSVVANSQLLPTPDQLSPGENCTAIVNPSFFLTTGVGCNGPFLMTARSLTGTVLAAGIDSLAIDVSLYLDDVIEISAVDTVSGLSCTAYFLVEDKQPPSITCPTDTVACTAPLHPDSLSAVVIGDNCDDDPTVTFVDVPMGPDCALFPAPFIAKVERNYMVEDEGGETATCTHEIFILRSDTTEIMFPAWDTLDCGQTADTSITGRPTIDGNPIEVGGLCNFALGFEDVATAEICDASSLIFRVWTVVNDCTGQIAVDTQRILILDATVPMLTCPDTLFFSTDTSACTASFTVPTPPATDSCSQVTVSAELSGSGVGFDHSGVAPGTYALTYTATDDCGNFAQCETTVVVQDTETPTAVCDEVVIVALPSNGVAVVAAAEFDDGSSDNCSPLNFMVSRDGGTFGPTVAFDCDDLEPDTVMVTLKVSELLNPSSMNFCMIQVVVQDKLQPILVCPDDLTVDCEENMDDLEMFGMPFIMDACTVNLVTSDTTDIGNCGFGTIVRTFTVTDASGNVAACDQTILVENQTPFDGAGIVFPPDYTVVNGCVTLADLEPGNLPPGFNAPVLPAAPCAMLATNHEDQVFYFDYPACYKIVRTWQVMDWCQFSTADPAIGIWSAQQVIAVMDTEPPVIDFCPPMDTFGLSANCGPAMVILPPVMATGTCTNEDITITNDSPFAASPGADASGTYPEGTHTVTFTVTDGCGNEATCSTTILVADQTDPTPYCEGTVTDLQAMPGVPVMAAVTAEHLNFASFDNCTAAEDLVFGIRRADEPAAPLVQSIVFGCADEGDNDIELWVTDEAGNSDFCVVNVIIQDNNNLCPDTLVAGVISGGVATSAGDDLPGVHIEIPGMSMEEMTDEAGGFLFDGLEVGNEYLIEPWKNDDPLNGITTFDLLLMTRHILNTEQITDPFRLIAADVNGSGSVTTSDVLELRKMVLHVYDEFPNNQSWRFVKAGYDFPDPTDPFNPPFPESLAVINHENDVLNADFTAVKIGDVNGSVSTDFGSGVGSRSRGTVSFQLEDREVAAGEVFTVPCQLASKTELSAVQFTIEFGDNLQLQGIEKGGLPSDCFETASPQAGAITGAWYHTEPVEMSQDYTLFSLSFRALRPGRLSELLRISPHFTPALAYSEAGVEQDLTINFENTSAMSFQLNQNQPNPFKKITHIGFTLPEAGLAKLTIYDLSGSILRTYEQDWSPGFHEVSIQRNELPTGGVLYYQLETADNRATKKMILLQ